MTKQQKVISLKKKAFDKRAKRFYCRDWYKKSIEMEVETMGLHNEPRVFWK